MGSRSASEITWESSPRVSCFLIIAHPWKPRSDLYYVDLAVTGAGFGCMYAMMAVGLTLVYGLLQILHVAHAAVFALGAYVTVVLSENSIRPGFAS